MINMKNETQISTFCFTELTRSRQEAIENVTIEILNSWKGGHKKDVRLKKCSNIAQATQENHKTEDFHHKIFQKIQVVHKLH